jgi:hypothetical protein
MMTLHAVPVPWIRCGMIGFGTRRTVMDPSQVLGLPSRDRLESLEQYVEIHGGMISTVERQNSKFRLVHKSKNSQN